ncbi:MAG: [FeFe] hydrogenase H-cluster radical SAM maturase HydG, partial [Gammaproteobacteria bacterium]|nr:[FeFe] hydrogenase H-cluster radical SAM maturase HydG [Gammaproteobacteria bacterium]
MIDPNKITDILTQHNQQDPILIREILAKAKELKGLDLVDVAALTNIQDPELTAELFATAKQIKDEIYGNRLVLFAPLYISNLCSNECLYCAFRATNKALIRRSLGQDEITNEAKNLIEQGQKRLLLVAGESYTRDGFQYILDSIDTIYKIKSNHGEIRRINVNIAPLTLDDFKSLKAAEIGTYQLFQETYDPTTYKQVHVAGKKSDYNWRLTAIDRAMQAKIDDVGIGVLFGLADWRFEILALLQHSQYLENKFGVGPHTISVPRLEPASGSDIAAHPPHPVTDADFRKIIAILRLAVPFTGIILSTRETSETRREALELGISQISAGSRTNPGGYSENEENASQFSLGDHRPLDEVIRDVAELGYIPSFCTACYRLGRTGEHFMSLAKTGKIKTMCMPNALTTFQEYLLDYASPATRETGE